MRRGFIVAIAALVLTTATACSAPAEHAKARHAGTTTEAPSIDDPLVRAELDNAWALAGQPADERPEVHLVRFVSLQESPDVMAQCMREYGWDVVASGGGWGGSGESGIAEGQLSAYWYDAYVCNAQYPTDPKYLRPFEHDQLDRLYDWYDTVLRQCIEDHGHTMTELPSRGRFVEDYYRMTWDAFSDAGDAIGNTSEGAHELDRLQTDCSMIPPADAGVW